MGRRAPYLSWSFPGRGEATFYGRRQIDMVCAIDTERMLLKRQVEDYQRMISLLEVGMWPPWSIPEMLWSAW